MANFERESLRFSMEVSNETDAEGNPKYTKKSINLKLKPDFNSETETEALNAIVTAFQDVLDYNNFGNGFVLETSNITNVAVVE